MAVKVTNFQTHYDNLKVSRSAPVEVIKASYKVLCLKHHPDRNNSSPESTKIMAIINESYEVLSDPEKRRRHDQWIDEQMAKNASMGGGGQSQSQTYSEADWEDWLNSKERERVYQERLKKEQFDKLKNDAGAAVDGLRNVNKNIVKPWIHRKIRQLLKLFYWCLGGGVIIAVILLSYQAVDRNNTIIYPDSSAQDSDGSIYYSDDGTSAASEAVAAAIEATAALDVAASLDVNSEYQPTVIIDNSAKEEMDASLAAISAAMGRGKKNNDPPEIVDEVNSAYNGNLSGTDHNYQTSFDCNMAKSFSEISICKNSHLANADVVLSGLVKDARAAIAAQDEGYFTNRLRKQWNYREKNCKDVKCLESWFNYQMSIMQSIAESGNAYEGA